MMSHESKGSWFRSVLGVLGLCTSLAAQGPLPTPIDVTYQWGASGGNAARTLSCTIKDNGADGTVSEGPTLTLGTARGFVAFPRVIGTNPGQVPPGATILQARLEFFVLGVPGAAATRQIVAEPVIDLSGQGPWVEPLDPVTDGSDVGISWLKRDSRPGIDQPWFVPGGDLLLGPAPFVAGTTIDQGSVGTWVTIDVTAVMGILVQGFSNQGWGLVDGAAGDDVVLAADDHPDPALRPRLFVRYLPGAAPFNRVPEAPDISLTITQGSSALVMLPLADPDGEAVTYEMRQQPVSGDLAGQLWWTYRPEAGFTGTDSFTYFAHDGIASSPMGHVLITVNPDPTSSMGLFQDDNQSLASESRATSFAEVADPAATTAQVTDEGPELKLAQGGWASVLDFPNLLGNGPGQIPPGAQVVSATLELYVVAAEGADPTRILSAFRVADPAHQGSWHEPDTPGVGPGLGVTWWDRDARPGQEVAWLLPGGDRDPAAAASTLVHADDDGVWVALDVTAALVAWSQGASNQGWILTSSSSDLVRVASNDHPDLSLRPKLTVVWSNVGGAGTPPDFPPVAVPGPDRHVVSLERVVLDGSGSFDPEGAALQSFWLQTAGPPVAPLPGSDPAQFIFDAPQITGHITLSFRLAVFDGAQLGIGAVEVEVEGGGNAPPVAILGPDLTVNERTLVSLDASASFDPEGGNLSFQWTQVAGPQVTSYSVFGHAPGGTGGGGPQPFMNNGHLNLRAPNVLPGQVVYLGWRVRVTDMVGNTSFDDIVIKVLPLPNMPPVAVAGSPQSVEAEDWVGLDGRGSSDPDPSDQIVSWSWTQAQGPPVTLLNADGPVPYFRAPSVSAATTIVLTLTVADLDAVTGTDTTTIAVDPHPVEFQGDINSAAPYQDNLTPREAMHLLRRAGYDASPARVAQVVAQGLTQTVTQLMTMVSEPAVDQLAWAHLPSIAPGSGDVWPQANLFQMERFWLEYIINSSNQLREKMAYFWTDLHAAAFRNLPGNASHWGLLYVDYYRQNALPGNYASFLLGMVRNELMLWWLDGFRNVAGAPNENFAREFWELFTLGQFDPAGNLNYTQNDIVEASRAYTGWRLVDPPEIAGPSKYARFNPSLHDSGQKTILGQTGNFDDAGVVNLTLQHPQAAPFISRKLFEYFVGRPPAPALEASLAASLIGSNWNISTLVATILKSSAMFSPEAHRKRVKNPLELLAGFIRKTGLVIYTSQLQLALRSLNHELANPLDVKGFPEGLSWIGQQSMVGRMQAGNLIVTSRSFQSQQGVSLAPLLPVGVASGAATVAHVARVLDLAPLSATRMSALVEYMDHRQIPSLSGGSNLMLHRFDATNSSDVDTKLRGLLWILFSLPEYQMN